MKLLKSNKFTNKLYAIIFMPLAISAILMVLSKISVNQALRQHKEAGNEVQKLTVNIYETRQYMRDFFLIDTLDKKFYQTGESKSLQTLEEFKSQVILNYQVLLSDEVSLDSDTKKMILDSKKLVFKNFSQFKKLVELKRKLGFKDWGQIGKWRQKVHLLEELNLRGGNESIKSQILELRRNEKDYLLRADDAYILKLEKTYKSLRNYLRQDNLKLKEKDTYISLLDDYFKEFKSYLDIEKAYHKLHETYMTSRKKSEVTILHIINMTAKKYQSTYDFFSIFIYSIIGFSFLLSIFIVNRLGNMLTKPIHEIDSHIKDLQDIDIEVLKKIHSVDEINHLRDSIINLKNQIEDQKSLLESQARLTTIGEISANISHEILNPLTIVNSHVALLRGKLKKGNIKLEEKDFNGIDNAVKKISEICNSIRKLARNEYEPSLEHFKIGDILAPVDFLLGQKLRESNVTLSVENECPNTVIEGNESLLSQVLLNLINNSRHAVCSESEKWIKIKITENDKDTFLKVIDSGKGISKDIRERLFKERVTTKSFEEGTGLGLPLCKKIIDEHKGNIWIDHHAENTTFVIRLPSYDKNSQIGAA